MTIKSLFFATTTTALLTLSLTAQAAPEGKFFIGTGIGMNRLFNPLKTSGTRYSYAKNGLLGQISTGYHYAFANHFSFGSELFINLQNTQFKDSTSFAAELKGKLRLSYGLRFMPGYQVTNQYNLYSIIGFGGVNTQYHYNSQRRTLNLPMIQAGIGNSYTFKNNLGVNTEVTYLAARNKNFTVGSRSFKTRHLGALDATASVYMMF
jgi:opacity protein-like surface antigen